jgi:hypothetical protein
LAVVIVSPALERDAGDEFPADVRGHARRHRRTGFVMQAERDVLQEALG